MFSEAARVLLALHSPFRATSLPAPAVRALIDRHGAAIDVELARLRSAEGALLLGAIEVIWGLGPMHRLLRVSS